MMSDKEKRSGKLFAVLALLLIPMLFILGCSRTQDDQRDSFGASLITSESLEGLILEGEGPIPARLIYRSRNTISSEEDWLVLEAIAQELDRLVELAGRLDEAVTEETAAMDQAASESE